MNRMLVYPFAGAAIGVMAAVMIVSVMSGGAPDTAAITLFVGVFLAGTGSIAGALVGLVNVLVKAERTRLTDSPGVSEIEGPRPNSFRDDAVGQIS